jgi:hypothetical protein
MVKIIPEIVYLDEFPPDMLEWAKTPVACYDPLYATVYVSRRATIGKVDRFFIVGHELGHHVILLVYVFVQFLWDLPSRPYAWLTRSIRKARLGI